MKHETIAILDFGSQYTQLIARRVRELGVYCEIHPADSAPEALKSLPVLGVILSGGPGSVYDDDALRPHPELLLGPWPVLGICYGMQVMMHELGGTVESGSRREYGPAEVQVRDESLFQGMEPQQPVWMSHGDRITALPGGFRVLGETGNAGPVAVFHPQRKLFALQFHPEVAHTRNGRDMLRRFLFEVCHCSGQWGMAAFLDEQVEAIRRRVGEGRVLAGLSGGVDSAVAALLIHRAVGDQLTCLFIDNGLLRKGEADQVNEDFARRFQVQVRHRDASQAFLEHLAGIMAPEEKRKRIGETFVRIFEEEAREIGRVLWLGQGTLYPDVIESASEHGAANTIKTHHNVGGLPEHMDLEVLEPLRMLFKDEVRSLGGELGLDEHFLSRHPFPGPGLAVRVVGEVTAERCGILREADAIFLQELHSADLYRHTAQAFAVLLPVSTVGVMGDYRTYENVVALRCVDTEDFMTADWSRLPAEFLGKVSSRIINEVRGVNRVVYDITSKPPATIEWE